MPMTLVTMGGALHSGESSRGWGALPGALQHGRELGSVPNTKGKSGIYHHSAGWGLAGNITERNI